MRYRLFLVGFALLFACGDDAEGPAVDAGGGSGGEGGARGGTGGRIAVDCPEGKQDTLEAFCAKNEGCELSARARWNSVCSQGTCSSTVSDCYFSMRNSCGGYNIDHVRNVDAHIARYYYDADGVLIGVSQYPYGLACAKVNDLYGTECESLTDGGRLDCSESDAGYEPDAG